MNPLAHRLTCVGIFLAFSVCAQVDEIKQKSSDNSSGRRGDSSGGGSSGIYVDIAFQSLQVFYVWQQEVLRKEESNPNITSVDILLQSAIQPSTYYIVNPRVRLNWGLFSTDFRMNYLIEQDLDGTKHIRTEDWQVVQLNLLTEKNITVRVGGGIMHESFSGGKTFSEWTAAVNLMNNNQRVGGMTEYRWAEVRKELSGFALFKVFQQGRLNTYLTAGVVFQRYYSSVNAWGMQGGVLLRFN